ncbi:conjugative transposon protein TraN [Sinomicrobium kalidii]|uniref:DUF4138 domain-containing protein n=1 Tax=Sinomicrobium kalidii TaxID=2900738 RepID=UPI001E4F99C4|nr:DUF4138 domain-containing protein [Sinomicrobium kalidii]UGU15423.1 conjugative transposon protein TraN [Sinomicrobium kalidii]
MKPIYFLFSLCLMHWPLMGQIQELDTIYANDHTTISLFFPEPVRQGIPGADHFVFTYNKENPQYLGLLKAVPGLDSNLLVITTDGQVYSYILKYHKDLPQLNYFIGKEKSIGHEKGMSFTEKKPQKKEERTVKITPYHMNAIKKVSEYMVRQDQRMARKNRKGVKLILKDIQYRWQEVYISFTIENKSGIDYEVDYFRVYVENGNRKKNASYQKILQEPIYSHEFPEKVKNNQQKSFVMVFPKFTLGKQEKLMMELGERNGHRIIKLKR